MFQTSGKADLALRRNHVNPLDSFSSRCLRFFCDLPLYLLGFPRRGKEPSRPKRILLVAAAYLGDTFWMLQMIPWLRTMFPDAELHLMGRPLSRTLFHSLVSDEFLHITSVLVSDRQREKVSIRAILAEADNIRRTVNPDLVFDLMSNRYTALFCRRIGAYSIGASIAGHFTVLFSFLVDLKPLSRAHLICRPRAIIRRYVTGEEISTVPPADMLPVVPKFSREEIFNRLGIPPDAKKALLFPGAGWKAKCWRPERYRTLARYLADNAFRVFVAGSPEERELCELVADRMPNVSILTDNFDETVSLMPHCALCVGNDSGPLQLVAAFKVPCIMLFCQTGPDFSTPIGRHVTALRASCPCFSENTQYCMNKVRLTCSRPEWMNIPCEQVFQALRNYDATLADPVQWLREHGETPAS